MKSPKKKSPIATKLKQKSKGLPGVKSIASRQLHMKTVLYGRSGTGKTTFAGTFPGPILVIDVSDEGTNSLCDIEDAKYIDLENFDHFGKIYWYLKDHPDEYGTVIVDTVSQLQQFAIEDHLKKKNKDPKKAGQWGSMTKQDWGHVSGELKNWLKAYRNLPMHIVFIAQDRTFNVEEDDDLEGVIMPEIGPRLMPSVASAMNADAQVICNTFIRQKTSRKRVAGRIIQSKRIEFGLRVGPNPVYVTKVRKARSIIIPDAIIDPTYDKLIEAMKGKNDGKK